jgi:3',5'-cyclic-AMP phosphodiesterase
MRILTIGSEATQLDAIPCLNAARGGGSEVVMLPVLEGTVDRLPPGVEALVVASDLQGVELDRRRTGPPRLLGMVVAERLAELSASGRLPPPDRVGVILAGDLYAESERRGGLGDVRPVWGAFAQQFRWVVGVAGNHDHFGSNQGRAEPVDEPGAHVLDESAAQLDGLVVAGVSGVIGNPRRPFRREEDDFVLAILSVLDLEPEILVLHEGPSVLGMEESKIGSSIVRRTLADRAGLLVVCGHCYWSEPLAALPGGPQVLNVDHRVVVLRQHA